MPKKLPDYNFKLIDKDLMLFRLESIKKKKRKKK